jgi:TfoX/Sxy family transcriptional regulator of competence genes
VAEIDGDTAARWESLVADMLAGGEATYGSEDGPQRAFGSTSLKTGGKIFAMLVKDRLVVKLPASRVEQLVTDGVGERFDPGHGRIQKEWLSVHASDPELWRTLAHESEAFVARRAR